MGAPALLYSARACCRCKHAWCTKSEEDPIWVQRNTRGPVSGGSARSSAAGSGTAADAAVVPTMVAIVRNRANTPLVRVGAGDQDEVWLVGHGHLQCKDQRS